LTLVILFNNFDLGIQKTINRVGKIKKQENESKKEKTNDV